jgi:hypothetical protein
MAKKIDTITMAVIPTRRRSLLIVSSIPEGSQGRPLQVAGRGRNLCGGHASWHTGVLKFGICPWMCVARASLVLRRASTSRTSVRVGRLEEAVLLEALGSSFQLN